LTSSQLFFVAEKKIKPQSKKMVLPQKNANVYFSKKTYYKDEAEKTKLKPLLYGF